MSNARNARSGWNAARRASERKPRTVTPYRGVCVSDNPEAPRALEWRSVGVEVGSSMSACKYDACRIDGCSCARWRNCERCGKQHSDDTALCPDCNAALDELDRQLEAEWPRQKCAAHNRVLCCVTHEQAGEWMLTNPGREVENSAGGKQRWRFCKQPGFESWQMIQCDGFWGPSALFPKNATGLMPPRFRVVPEAKPEPAVGSIEWARVQLASGLPVRCTHKKLPGCWRFRPGHHPGDHWGQAHVFELDTMSWSEAKAYVERDEKWQVRCVIDPMPAAKPRVGEVIGRLDAMWLYDAGERFVAVEDAPRLANTKPAKAS